MSATTTTTVTGLTVSRAICAERLFYQEDESNSRDSCVMRGITVTGLTVKKGIYMTEMVNGEGQSFSNSSAGAPVSTPSSTPSSAPSEERTFRQSEVNDLVGRAKHEAVERFKRDSAMASQIGRASCRERV